MTLFEILLLYLLFRLKQVTCDFFLQSSWMAMTKGNPLREGGARALFAHAGVHAFCTLFIVLLFAAEYMWLALVDFAAHAVIDKAKALVNNKYGWTYRDNQYWWIFGIDQEAHNLTHLVYIIILVMGLSAEVPLY